jgi:hypothetical protein
MHFKSLKNFAWDFDKMNKIVWKKPNVKLTYLKSMQYKDEDANTNQEEGGWIKQQS